MTKRLDIFDLIEQDGYIEVIRQLAAHLDGEIEQQLNFYKKHDENWDAALIKLREAACLLDKANPISCE